MLALKALTGFSLWWAVLSRYRNNWIAGISIAHCGQVTLRRRQLVPPNTVRRSSQVNNTKLDRIKTDVALVWLVQWTRNVVRVSPRTTMDR